MRPEKKSVQKQNQVVVLPPPPRGKKGIALTTSGHVRDELARLYRQCRRGDLDVAQGTKLAFILATLARLIEQGCLEARIEALERQQETKR